MTSYFVIAFIRCHPYHLLIYLINLKIFWRVFKPKPIVVTSYFAFSNFQLIFFKYFTFFYKHFEHIRRHSLGLFSNRICSLGQYKNRFRIAHSAAYELCAIQICTLFFTCIILAQWCNIIFTAKKLHGQSREH